MDIEFEIDHQIALLTLNRIHKSNAFDNQLLHDMQQFIEEAIAMTQVRVLMLRANGKHFCAGADLAWMRDMARFSEEENIQDALVLGRLMHTLYMSPKPTLAVVQGSAFGGGAGLAAACDITFAADNARFCFSEVKIGLIPAVISPYVIKAIGERRAKALFMSAEVFSAFKAYEYGLIHECLPEDKLAESAFNYAKQIADNAPVAVQDAKLLVNDVSNHPINNDLVAHTAALIAKKRVSAEGQHGLDAFLNKKSPNWN